MQCKLVCIPIYQARQGIEHCSDKQSEEHQCSEVIVQSKVKCKVEVCCKVYSIAAV